VGCGEGNLGKRAFCDSRSQRQRIFELMGGFAQLAETASRRITLERMHRAPDATHNLIIARLLLQPERVLVQRLEKLQRALEEELAEFGAAIVRLLAHSFSSTR